MSTCSNVFILYAIFHFFSRFRPDISPQANHSECMKKLQAYKFKLKMNNKTEEEILFRKFSDCCRFVWNKALALEKENYENGNTRLGYTNLANTMKEWKGADFPFLKKAHSQILQQSLKELGKAYKNFFAKRADFPKFKAKGKKDSFRFPQGCKLDQGNFRIFLPKIGWIKYFNSREVLGTIKNVTVSLKNDAWYVSIQTELNVPERIHFSGSSVGIDMGIAQFATLSTGEVVSPINVLRTYESKLAKLQRKLSKKKLYSANWRKTKKKISKLHIKIADTRKDFLNKTSTILCKNHAKIVLEDLKVANMSASAKGSLDAPGKNVKAKSGLNKSILDQGWHIFRSMLQYKSQWLGGEIILVSPKYTSQKCSHCGYIAKENRKTQSKFNCVSCGFEMNADHNAAINILAAGHAVFQLPELEKACGAGRAQAPAMKQESILVV